MPEISIQPTDDDLNQKEILQTLVAIYASATGTNVALDFNEFKLVKPDQQNGLTEDEVKVVVSVYTGGNPANHIAGSPFTVQVLWAGGRKIELIQALHQGLRAILP